MSEAPPDGRHHALPRARVIRARAEETIPPPRDTLAKQGLSTRTRERILAAELEAKRTVAALLEEAHARAAAVVEEARARAAVEAAHAAQEAAEAERAKLAAQFLALREEEARRDARDLDRAVDLARALAERLLGAALAVDRATSVHLAREVLREARGARRVCIEVHAMDAEALAADLASASPLLAPAVARDALVEVRANDELARGSVRVHTDLGTLDARLPARLDRLASAIRDALRDGAARR